MSEIDEHLAALAVDCEWRVDEVRKELSRLKQEIAELHRQNLDFETKWLSCRDCYGSAEYEIGKLKAENALLRKVAKRFVKSNPDCYWNDPKLECVKNPGEAPCNRCFALNALREYEAGKESK